MEDESNGEFYTNDDDVLLQEKPSKIIPEESIMSNEY
jgi:hypothetical protein